MVNPKVKAPKAPKVKKPKRKPVLQKQKQRQIQNVNVRVINNNNTVKRGKTGTRTPSRTPAVEYPRTSPVITTYPLFREQYDVPPILSRQEPSVLPIISNTPVMTEIPAPFIQSPIPTPFVNTLIPNESRLKKIKSKKNKKISVDNDDISLKSVASVENSLINQIRK